MEFILTRIKGQTDFITIAEAIADEKATPAKRNKSINEIITAIETLMATLPTTDEYVNTKIGKVMPDTEVIAGETMEKGCVEILEAFKGADFFGDADLKAACEKFAAVNDYAM